MYLSLLQVLRNLLLAGAGLLSSVSAAPQFGPLGPAHHAPLHHGGPGYAPAKIPPRPFAYEYGVQVGRNDFNKSTAVRDKVKRWTLNWCWLAGLVLGRGLRQEGGAVARRRGDGRVPRGAAGRPRADRDLHRGPPQRIHRGRQIRGRRRLPAGPPDIHLSSLSAKYLY